MANGNGELKAHLKNVLQNHTGRTNAIPRRELRVVLGQRDDNNGKIVIVEPNDRAVRIMINELRHEGMPILSSVSGKNGGYYLPADRQELDEGLRVMRSYLIEFARDMRDVKIAGRQLLEKPAPPVQERLI